MFLPQPGIDDMEGLLAALESLLDERQQYPILLGRAVKEGAEVKLCTKHSYVAPKG